MSNARELFIDIVDHTQFLVMHLDGVVNEDNRLMADASNYANRKIVINPRKLRRLNSCGVRDWVRWVQALEKAGNQIFLISCHPAVVSQINMVSNFCGSGGKVLSFDAPYYCETCETERMETFISTHLGPRDEPPPALCGTCGETMEFDDAQSYFAFTRVHGVRKEGDALDAILPRLGEFQQTTKIAMLKGISEASRMTTDPTGKRDETTPVSERSMDPREKS